VPIRNSQTKKSAKTQYGIDTFGFPLEAERTLPPKERDGELCTPQLETPFVRSRRQYVTSKSLYDPLQ
jgi:hypothetical protein